LSNSTILNGIERCITTDAVHNHKIP